MLTDFPLPIFGLCYVYNSLKSSTTTLVIGTPRLFIQECLYSHTQRTGRKHADSAKPFPCSNYTPILRMLDRFLGKLLQSASSRNFLTTNTNYMEPRVRTLEPLLNAYHRHLSALLLQFP